MSEFVIFDTEYTTWEGCITNGWHGQQKKEIVQIGAIKADAATLQIKDIFQCLIQPTKNPRLSDYFVKLTGISNEEVVREGISFAKAYEQFCRFCGDCPCLYHCWNETPATSSDGDIMEENIRLNQIEDCRHLQYVNVAPWFRQRYAEAGIKVEKQSSGEIAGILGVTVEGNLHNALFDAASIFKGIAYFKGKDLVKLWK